MVGGVEERGMPVQGLLETTEIIRSAADSTNSLAEETAFGVYAV